MVNDAGGVLLDCFVQQKERVTDFRTWVSGVRPHDLRGAAPLADIQREVAAMLTGRTLVGHSVDKDLTVCQASRRYLCFVLVWSVHSLQTSTLAHGPCIV